MKIKVQFVCSALFGLLSVLLQYQSVSAVEAWNKSFTEDAFQRSQVIDIELRGDGALVGQSLSNTGMPRLAASITLVQDNEVVSESRTNPDGEFSITGLRGGVYELRTDTSTRMVRLWAPGTAPPSAVDAAILIDGDNIVRGQQFGGPPNPFAIQPADVLFWSIVGAGIGIPIAIAENKKASQ